MDQPAAAMTHYAVLRVGSNADAATIKTAYRAAARRTHPDLGGDPGEAAAVTEAYRVLADPAARAAYDHGLAAARRAHDSNRGYRLFDALPVRAWAALAYVVPFPMFPVAFFIDRPELWTLRFHSVQAALVAMLLGASGAAHTWAGGDHAALALAVPVAFSAAVAWGRQPRIPGVGRLAAAIANLGGPT